MLNTTSSGQYVAGSFFSNFQIVLLRTGCILILVYNLQVKSTIPNLFYYLEKAWESDFSLIQPAECICHFALHNLPIVRNNWKAKENCNDIFMVHECQIEVNDTYNNKAIVSTSIYKSMIFQRHLGLRNL